MTQKPNGFDTWFSQVKEIHTARGGAGLAETEDWVIFFREGLSPGVAIEKYLEQNS